MKSLGSQRGLAWGKVGGHESLKGVTGQTNFLALNIKSTFKSSDKDSFQYFKIGLGCK